MLTEKDDIIVSRVTIWKFLRNYAHTRSLARREGSGQPSKVTSEIQEIVDRQMKIDDETTAYQLHKLLVDNGHTMSIAMILRCRKQLGWTVRG